jgi:hypothetical protein
VHREFVLISDRPEVLRIDDGNRPHAEAGPFCQWRDGTALYAWHGTYVPAAWIEDRASLDPQTALTWPNVEQRRAAAEIVGWAKVLAHVNAREVDVDHPEIGTLLTADLPDAPGSKFLNVRCGTGRDFVLPVPREMTTARQSNAWTYSLDAGEYQPEERT